jgi:hypothetical protein
MKQVSEIIFWNDIKGRLKQKYPELNNSDLQWRNSSQNDLVEMIAIKLGKTTRELQLEIELLEEV